MLFPNLGRGDCDGNPVHGKHGNCQSLQVPKLCTYLPSYAASRHYPSTHQSTPQNREQACSNTALTIFKLLETNPNAPVIFYGMISHHVCVNAS
mmetsp:Transcript_122636/g.192448  ORF Transcript_122636/g.192448 Transcript_122636/m.192448 type:complete len:94 (-) Transcript_122636:13-294(-)